MCDRAVVKHKKYLEICVKIEICAEKTWKYLIDFVFPAVEMWLYNFFIGLR